MKINILNADDSVSSVQVEWHPECLKSLEPGQKTLCPGSLWTTKSRILEHYRRVNDVRRGLGAELRDLSDPDKAVAGIQFAEAQLEIYIDTDDGEPWRHWGTLCRVVPYDRAVERLFM